MRSPRYLELTDAERELALTIVARAGSPPDGSPDAMKALLRATVEEMHDRGMLPGWEPPDPIPAEHLDSIKAVGSHAAAALAYNQAQVRRMSGSDDGRFRR